MEIVLAPNPILEQVAEKIEDINEFKDILLVMKDYCKNGENVGGLALPQIGISKRAFVMKMGRDAEIIINPEIIKKSKFMTSLKSGESCLSIPDKKVIIRRHRSVKVKYTTIHGEERRIKLKGVFSIIFQHEYDHLDGILITAK